MIFNRAVLCSKNLHFFLDFFSEGINKMNCVFEIIYTPTESNFPELDKVFPIDIVKYSKLPDEREYLFRCFQSFRILEVTKEWERSLGDNGTLSFHKVPLV